MSYQQEIVGGTLLYWHTL